MWHCHIHIFNDGDLCFKKKFSIPIYSWKTRLNIVWFYPSVKSTYLGNQIYNKTSYLEIMFGLVVSPKDFFKRILYEVTE